MQQLIASIDENSKEQYFNGKKDRRNEMEQGSEDGDTDVNDERDSESESEINDVVFDSESDIDSDSNDCDRPDDPNTENDESGKNGQELLLQGGELDSIRTAPLPRVNNDHIKQEKGVPTILQSKCGRTPTVWFEYPNWLGIQRSRENLEINTVEDAPPLKYRSRWERNCIKDIFRAAGMNKVDSTKRSALIWGKHLRNFSHLHKNQRCNHFPGSWCLGRKDRICFLMSKKKRDHGLAYDFFPECYVLPFHRDRLKQRLTNGARKGLWIRKPLASSQGRGIHVLDHKNVHEMVHKKGKYKRDPKVKMKESVIQKYIEKPFLIDGTKFDIRIYVLVTSFSPLRIYMFPDGLVRFCTKKYSNKNKSNRFGHLTNYSINKKSDAFQHNVDAEEDNVGSKWSFSALLRYLKNEKGETTSQDVMNQIRHIVVKTIIAADDDVTTKLHQRVPKVDLCFELFGFDLMLDSKLRAWLIEVNVSPSLMTASPLDRKIKTIMMCDLLHTVGIPYEISNSNNNSISITRNQSERSFSSAKSSLSSESSSTRTSSSSDMNFNTTRFGGLSKKQSMTPKRHVGHLRSTTWDQLPEPDKDILYKVCEENERKGHFERVFPPSDRVLYNHYMSLFSSERYSNVLVQQFEDQAREVIYSKGGAVNKLQNRNLKSNQNYALFTKSFQKILITSRTGKQISL